MQSELGGIQDYIQIAMDNVREASKGISVLERSSSTAAEVLEKIKAMNTHWEMLAKKHQVTKVMNVAFSINQYNYLIQNEMKAPTITVTVTVTTTIIMMITIIMIK